MEMRREHISVRPLEENIINTNIIKRNPRKFVGLLFGLPLLAFAVTALPVAFVGSAIPAITAAMPFLAFMLPFGPIGAALIFAALIAAATLVVFSISSGIAAAASSRTKTTLEPLDEDAIREREPVTTLEQPHHRRSPAHTPREETFEHDVVQASRSRSPSTASQ